MIDTSLPCSVLTVSDIYSQGVYASSLFKDLFAVADLCKRDSFFICWFLLFVFVCPQLCWLLRKVQLVHESLHIAEEFMNTSEEYRIFTVITVKSSGPFYSVYVVYADIHDIGSRNVELFFHHSSTSSAPSINLISSSALLKLFFLLASAQVTSPCHVALSQWLTCTTNVPVCFFLSFSICSASSVKIRSLYFYF